MSGLLRGVAFHETPFPHLLGRSSLEIPPDCLHWLRTQAPWKLTVTEFYEQFELSLSNTDLPATVETLASETTLRALRSDIRTHFHTPLSDRVDVTAHKLVPGQTIRVHNDHLAGGETHRLLLQLTPRWQPAHGGHLMLFAGAEPETVTNLIEPIAGSVQAFAVSPKSYHAVSTVHSEERYTAVYSFYGGRR